MISYTTHVICQTLISLFYIADKDEVVCEEEDGHISYHVDKKECAKYYMCEGKRRHHMPCPVNLVFNPNENVCDWPENVDDCESVTGGRKP